MTLEELSVVFTADIQPFAQAVEAVQGLASGAAGAVDGMAASFHRAGLQAAAGLQSGLLAGRQGVMAAAEQIANAAAQALQAALQIHSPSRVTREMGKMFDEGFLQGILEQAPRLEMEAGQLRTRTDHALQAAGPLSPSQGAANAPQAPVQLTIPLELDGYRLGVAVIENLNRITNGTGRVELRM